MNGSHGSPVDLDARRLCFFRNVDVGTRAVRLLCIRLRVEGYPCRGSSALLPLSFAEESALPPPFYWKGSLLEWSERGISVIVRPVTFRVGKTARIMLHHAPYWRDCYHPEARIRLPLCVLL